MAQSSWQIRLGTRGVEIVGHPTRAALVRAMANKGPTTTTLARGLVAVTHRITDTRSTRRPIVARIRFAATALHIETITHEALHATFAYLADLRFSAASFHESRVYSNISQRGRRISKSRYQPCEEIVAGRVGYLTAAICRGLLARGYTIQIPKRA